MFTTLSTWPIAEFFRAETELGPDIFITVYERITEFAKGVVSRFIEPKEFKKTFGRDKFPVLLLKVSSPHSIGVRIHPTPHQAKKVFRAEAEVGPYIENYLKNVGAMLRHRP